MWQIWSSIWKAASLIDQRYIFPWTQAILNFTTNLFYDIIIVPLETLFVADRFFTVICIAAIPFLLITTATQYTLNSFYGGRRAPRTKNLRLRTQIAYRRLGGRGTVRHLPSFLDSERGNGSRFASASSEFESLLKYKPLPSTSPFSAVPLTIVDRFLSQVDVLLHYDLLTSVTARTFPTHYTALTPADPRYQRIYLEARGLQTTLSHYKQQVPLHNPQIYMSSKKREHPIVIDTGASCSVTPNIHDFITTPTSPDEISMEGLNGEKTAVVGEGTIQWDIEDIHGTRDHIETFAYYMPKANVRLFSPQVYVTEQADQQNPHCELRLNSKGTTLTLANGTELQFPFQQGSNLPIMLTHKALHPENKGHLCKEHTRKSNRFANLAQFLCSSTFAAINNNVVFNSTNSEGIAVPKQIGDSPAVLQRSNWNLSDAQKELLLWHSRLGHINLQHVQALLAKPANKELKRVISPANNKSSHCERPLCEACQYAKQKRRNPPSSLTRSRPENEGALSRNILIPGQRVSVDLYQSATRGRLPYSFGKEKIENQFTGGAIFVDSATKVIHHTHQFSTTASETVNSKHTFENFCDEFGVTVKEYVGDNNPFHSQDWKDDCQNQGQRRMLSGVGAHHQVPVERYIQTIFSMSRAMMLHFSLHWPQAAKADLWPFAVDHAVYIWNRLPNSVTKLSPLEHFTSTLFPNHHHLQRLHVFGCPVYVLDPKLQDGKRLPKWNKRSRRGVYLGISKLHSSTVHLVLNLQTGKVTPQYHVVFDDTFSTVFSDGTFTDDVWNSLTISNIERHDDADTALDIEPFHTQESDIQTTNTQQQVELPQTSVPEGATSETEGVAPATDEGTPDIEGATSVAEGREHESVSFSPPPPLRRSTRARKPVDRLISHYQSLPRLSGSKQVMFKHANRLPKVPGERLNQQYLGNLSWSALLSTCNQLTGTLGSFASEHQKSSYDRLVEYLNPALFMTMANKEDNPTLKEAMASPDAAGFIAAMELEVRTLMELNVFEIVPRPIQKVISGVWAFRRKRYPDGGIRKLKARYCARGFEQKKGVDYFETFAPVVMWLTVRLLLTMSILMKLETKQIDYTAAFVHAPIDCLVYVEMPIGFAKEGHVWKLQRSLYGLAQSPRNFFLHTKAQLQKLGFTQSIADPCLFISRDVICLIYVDDALLFYKNPEAVDRLTKRMTEENIQFREEEDVAGFLGVHIDHKDDGSIHLTQKGLAERIVEALHLTDSSIRPVETPATDYLPIDKNGESAHEMFNYPSVVGQLNYLSGHTRCDITMATSQVARFVHQPKRSHELALIRIGRYLKGTLDKGLILRPQNTDNLKLDVYVDAAFACGWGTEESTNPDSVKSRTGYIIELAGCPILWVSKLQTTIATSTMESEYTALSMALRAFIPLQAVAKSILSGLRYGKPETVTFKATIHEDNQGALILSSLEPGRSTIRSKFYALKLHWFRSWTQRNNIEIVFIETTLQKADYLTKAPAPVVFKRNRQLSMGW